MIANNYIDKIRSKIATPAVLNIFWLSLDKIIKLFVGLFVGVWITRYLGPAQWGQLNYVLALLTIASAIVNLGMDGFLVKEILENPENKNKILGTSFFMRLAMAPSLIGILFLYFYIINISASYYLLLAFLSIALLTSPLELIDIEFQSRLKSKLTVVSKNTAYILGSSVKIYLLFSGKPLIWFAAAMGLESLLSYALLCVMYQRDNDMLKWSYNKDLITKYFSIGWPFILSNMAVILYMRLDQIMLKSLAGEKELGLFSSVVRISDLFTFLPMVVSSSYLPSLIQAKKNGENSLEKSTAFLINWMTRISLFICIFVTIFSDYLIKALYGNEYIDASSILTIHIWSIIPIFVGVASSQYLVLENLQKLNLYKTCLGLVFNIVFNIVLIPKYGALGAACATITSYFISAIISNAFFSQTQKLLLIQLKSVWMIFDFSK